MKKQLCGLRRLGYLALAALLALVVAPAAALADGDTTDETTEGTTTEDTTDDVDDATDDATDETDDAGDAVEDVVATYGTATVYRLYNQYSGEHLFTTDENEYAELETYGWTQEGEAFYAVDFAVNDEEATEEDLAALAEEAGLLAVYRLYNPYTGEHLFTTDLNEYAVLETYGWEQEGIAFYAYDLDVDEDAIEEEVAALAEAAGLSVVYRLYNPYELSCNHLFTVDVNEYDVLATYGWNQEGIAWFGVAASDDDDATDAEADDDADTDATDDADDDALTDSDMVDDDDMAVDSEDDDATDEADGDTSTDSEESAE